MATSRPRTFIVDCHVCKAKVAATESGRAELFTSDDESEQPYGTRVFVGNCPSCGTILVDEPDQVDIEGIDAYGDRWSD
ncbi:MAG: hypothetical protein PHS32_16585, partial [Rhodoferax sp.]|uniref:hypothetical protein n=1 Tax=Rhodoferax sp. TaxID=50421 RepID=UPI00262D4D98